MNTVALNNLWTYQQGLMLSQSEREWLVRKLSEPVEKVSDEAKEDTAKKHTKRFPYRQSLNGCVYTLLQHLDGIVKKHGIA